MAGENWRSRATRVAELRPTLVPVVLLLLLAQAAVLRIGWFTVFLQIVLAALFFASTRLLPLYLRRSLNCICLCLTLFFSIYQLWQIRVLRTGTIGESRSFSVLVDSFSYKPAKGILEGYGWIVSAEAKGLRIHFRGPADEQTLLVPGSVYYMNAEVERLTSARSPGAFNASAWSVKKGVYARIRWRLPHDVHLRQKRPLARLFTRFFSKARSFFTAQLTSAAGNRTGGLAAAMLYGDESHLDPEDEALFQDFGLTHVLVASGTNVSLCLNYLAPFSKKLFRKQGSRLLVQLGTLLFLASLSLGEPAMLRASIMKAIELIHHKRALRTLQDNYLYLSVLVIAVISPHLLVSTGFLMSCFATQAVYLQGSTADHETRGQSVIAKKLGDKLTLYAAIQLALLPFSWRAGRLYSFAAILANLFLLPLTFVLLLWAFVFLFLIPLPPAAAWLGLALRTLYGGIRTLLAGAAFLADFGFIARRCHLAFLPFLPWRRLFQGAFPLSRQIASGRRKTKRTFFWTKILLSISILAAVRQYQAGQRGLYFLDVGQGDASLFWDGRTAILIDSGPVGSGRLLQDTLAYLEIEKIDFVFLTHLDQDHVAGLGELLGSGSKVDHVFISEPIMGNEEKMAKLNSMAAKATDEPLITTLFAGDVLTIGKVDFTILGPLRKYLDSNDGGLVFLSETDGQRVLWMGDAGFAAEADLLRADKLSDVDILHVAHHGARNSSSPAFVRTVQAEIAVISCGFRNRYGHPVDEVVSLLSIEGLVVRTDLAGTMLLSASRGKSRLESTLVERYLPGDYDRIIGMEDAEW